MRQPAAKSAPQDLNARNIISVTPPKTSDNMGGPTTARKIAPRRTMEDPLSINNIHDTLEKLVVPIDGLKNYGANPNQGFVPGIIRSLEKNGQYKPIVVRTGSMEVLAGNHTLMAAKEMGWTEIAVTFVTVDDDAAARIVLVDNRSRDKAEYDQEALEELLATLGDLEGTGFDQADLDNMVFGEEQEPAEAPDSADEIPEAREPVARPGDLFVLGDHRAICGDATDPTVVSALLDGERPDMMWTDPPYGVEYEGKTADALTIKNDGAEGLPALLAAAFANAVSVLKPGAPVYVSGPQGPQIAVFQNEFLGAGFLWRQNLVWVKNSMVLGHSDYHYKHEPILHGEAPPDPAEVPAGVEVKTNDPVLYGFTPGGEGRLGRGGPRWYGSNAGVTVFEVPKPPASREHPTMKPVKLVLAMLANSVRPGRLVFDPFAGSGSTLIAAQYHGAKARVIELDPHYMDLICARFQQETGVLPRRNGVEIDFIGGI